MIWNTGFQYNYWTTFTNENCSEDADVRLNSEFKQINPKCRFQKKYNIFTNSGCYKMQISFLNLQTAPNYKFQNKYWSIFIHTDQCSHLSLAPSTATETTEGNNLLLGHHILQVTHGTLQMHVLNGLGSLAGVLHKAVEEEMQLRQSSNEQIKYHNISNQSLLETLCSYSI